MERKTTNTGNQTMREYLAQRKASTTSTADNNKSATVFIPA